MTAVDIYAVSFCVDLQIVDRKVVNTRRADVTLVITRKFVEWRRGRDFNPATFCFASDTGKKPILAKKYASDARLITVAVGSAR